MSIKADLKKYLEEILQTMEDRGFQTYMVSMNKSEIEEVLDMIDRTEDMTDEYTAGYQYGYKRALVDAVKLLREMEWHGGSKS